MSERTRHEAQIGVFVLSLVLFPSPLNAQVQHTGQVAQLGLLGLFTPELGSRSVAALSEGLGDLGWREGQKMRYEHRYASGRRDQLAALATQLVQQKVDVIVTIVAGDPVGSGLVARLARPGGNVTGLTTQATDWAAKQLQLLREVAPGIKRVGVLWNPTLPQHQAIFRETQKAAAILRLEIESVELRSPDDLEAVFQRIAHTRVDGLQVYDQPALVPQRQRVVDWVTRLRIPAIYGLEYYVDIGGLMSYSPNLADLFRRSTTYVEAPRQRSFRWSSRRRSSS